MQSLDWKSTTHYWIWGVSGAGKSWMARTHYTVGEYFTKTHDKWWCGYRLEPTVLYDDIDGQSDILHLMSKLKTIADIYPFPAPVKHHPSLSIRPQRIIVTANMSIDQIMDRFPLQEQMRGPLLRRFTQIEMKQKYISARKPGGISGSHQKKGFD